MIGEVIPSIINNQYSILNKSYIEGFNADKINQELQNILKPIALKGKFFWLMKRAKNLGRIAETIITEDGRNMLLRLKEDKDTLEKLMELFQVKERYKTTTYFPFDTKQDKSISHHLNQSFYGFFQSEVEGYSQLKIDNKAWKSEMSEKIGGANMDDYEECVFTGKFPKIQNLLFSDLGSELPVNKTVNGVQSMDYNFAFYIPLFQWLMPEAFHKNIKDMNESDLRKLHIRKIKEFISGKI